MTGPRDSGGGPRALGAVLAGGAGRRLGGTKATAQLLGRPLIAHPLAALREAGLEAIVVAKRDSALPPLDCEVVFEPDIPRHPLCGIVTALRHAGRPVVALGCDMPCVPPALLAELAAAGEPLVVAEAGGGLQPFPGRYGPELLPALERALDGQRALQAAIASLRPRLLAAAELENAPEAAFLNVNTPEDLAGAARLLEAERAP